MFVFFAHVPPKPDTSHVKRPNTTTNALHMKISKYPAQEFVTRFSQGVSSLFFISMQLLSAPLYYTLTLRHRQNSLDPEIRTPHMLFVVFMFRALCLDPLAVRTILHSSSHIPSISLHFWLFALCVISSGLVLRSCFAFLCICDFRVNSIFRCRSIPACLPRLSFLPSYLPRQLLVRPGWSLVPSSGWHPAVLGSSKPRPCNHQGTLSSALGLLHFSIDGPRSGLGNRWIAWTWTRRTRRVHAISWRGLWNQRAGSLASWTG